MSTPFRLLVPRILLEEMISHACAENPNECCGLLAGVVEDGEGGKTGRVTRRYPLVNEAASPKEFLSDGRSMLDADKDMRRYGVDLLAIYHSHPTSPPVPSRKDIERSYYGPGVMSLIVSLTTQPPTVQGWWLTDTDYREAEWEIV